MRTRSIFIPFLIFLIAAMPARSIARADQADDQYAVAAGHYQAKRWKLAAEEFLDFVKKYPNHPQNAPSLFFLAESLLQDGRWALSQKYFQEYIEREPLGKYFRPALFRAGESAYLSQQKEIARKFLEDFQSRYPDDALNAYVLPYLGELALAREDFLSAEKYFQKTLEKYPDSRLTNDCRFGLAKSYEKLRNYALAASLYRELLAKPTEPWAEKSQFHLGAMQYSMGEYQEAIGSFQNLLRQWPHTHWQQNAKLGIGWSLFNLRKLDEADAYFLDLKNDPQWTVEAFYWHGLVLKGKKQWQDAAQIFETAQKIDEKHPLQNALHYHAGNVLLQMGDLAAAKLNFEAVLNASSPDPQWCDPASYGLIQIASRLKNYPTLDRLTASFVETFPKSSNADDAQRLRAESLLERKEWDAAAAILEPLLTSTSPREKEAETRFLLTLAYQGNNRFADALNTLQPVIDSAAPLRRFDAELLKGVMLVSQKKYAEAVPSLESYCRNLPQGNDIARALGHLAVCYARTGKLDRAKELYTQLMHDYSDYPLLAKLIDQLASAAYDANDPHWSEELSTVYIRLGGKKTSPRPSTSSDTSNLLAESVKSSGDGAKTPIESEKSPGDASAASPTVTILPAPGDASNPLEIKGLLNIGWSRFKAGKFDEAAEAFSQVLDKIPSESIAAEATYARALSLENAGRADAALALYDSVIQQYGESKQHYDALLAAARLHSRLRQYRQAENRYREIFEKHPHESTIDAALYERAWNLMELGKNVEAAALFDRIHDDYPQSKFHSDASYQLAHRAYEDKEFSRTRNLLDEVLAESKETLVRNYALFLKGQTYVAEKNWPRIREVFEKYRTDFSDDPQCLKAEFWIAESLYREEKFEEAQKAFEQLVRTTQGRRDAWLGMVPLRYAQVLAQEKRWDEAYAVASKIADDYPDFEQQYEADYLLGRCLANRGDFEEARHAYARAIASLYGEKTETAALAQLMIGETYFHQKNYELALKEYLRTEALYDYPERRAAALYQAGVCYDLLGQKENATNAFKMILKKYDKTSYAEKANNRLGYN